MADRSLTAGPVDQGAPKYDSANGDKQEPENKLRKARGRETKEYLPVSPDSDSNTPPSSAQRAKRAASEGRRSWLNWLTYWYGFKEGLRSGQIAQGTLTLPPQGHSLTLAAILGIATGKIKDAGVFIGGGRRGSLFITG